MSIDLSLLNIWCKWCILP